MSSGKDSENAGSVDGDGRELFEDGGITCHENKKDRGDLKNSGYFAYETWPYFRMIIGKE
jgi:hypothetical protein